MTRTSRSAVAPPRCGFTLVEVLVVLTIISLLLGLTLPAVQKARNTAGQTACLNNVKQVGTGLHSFHATHGFLPPLPRGNTNWQGSSSTVEQIGWHVYLLPFIEREDVWRMTEAAYAQNPDPLSVPHRAPMACVVRTYTCPVDSRLTLAYTDEIGYTASFTSYLAVTGSYLGKRDGCFPGRPGISLRAITDGTSQTIMVGERPPPAALSAGWWYTTHAARANTWEFEMAAVNPIAPENGCPGFAVTTPSGTSTGYIFAPGQVANNCDLYHFWSLHSGGATFLFADGSARFLPYSVSPVLKNLASRSGGETAAPLD
jgi:prepilin-type N-terminal cleavage/methylation domain-containing protein/prepilin-type processing-associated H-X9-DG protein